MLQGTDRAFAR